MRICNADFLEQRNKFRFKCEKKNIRHLFEKPTLKQHQLLFREKRKPKRYGEKTREEKKHKIKKLIYLKYLYLKYL